MMTFPVTLPATASEPAAAAPGGILAKRGLVPRGGGVLCPCDLALAAAEPGGWGSKGLEGGGVFPLG